MSMKIHGSELGVAGCDFVVEGETAEDVINQMIDHLDSEHDIKLPKADVIIDWSGSENTTLTIQQDIILIIERIRDELNLGGSDAPQGTGQAISRAPQG